MAKKAVKAGPVATGTDLRKSDLAITSENRSPLAHLQASRLSHLFALSYETASTIAALAWGVAR